MAKTNNRPPETPSEARMGAARNTVDNHETQLLYSLVIERLKVETKLFLNLAMCEAQLKSFTDEFTNSCLSGHTLMEWSDRVEKLNKAKTMIQKLIETKIKEWMLEKKT